MYSISSNNGRRASDTPARPELPILFHLVDVSRPRVTDLPPVVEPLTHSDPVPAAAITMMQPPVSLATIETKPLTLSAAIQPELAPPVQPEAAPIAAAAPPPPSKTNATPSKTTTQSASHAPATAEQAKVTLKGPKPDRRKKRTPASEDWFASHGKFIAMAFVVALIGTVYLARANRPKPAAESSESANLSPLVEIVPVSKESPASDVPTVAAAAESKVELQAPTAPPLLTGTNAGEKASADKLFEFASAKRSEEQVAARPNSATSDKAAGSAAESAENSPVLVPAYPVTTGGSASYPTAANTPTAYPQTRAPAITNLANGATSPTPQGPVAMASNTGPGPQGAGYAPPSYGSQYPAQSQMTAPTGWSPPNAPPSGQYQSYDNTARGPRYERTGSGHY